MQAAPAVPQSFAEPLVLQAPAASQQPCGQVEGLHAGGVWQAPPMHRVPAAHLWPQVPQSFALVSRFTQPVLQHCSDPVHAGPPLHVVAGWQLPVAQLSPGAQTRPQFPQLFGSVCVLAQPLAQHCSTPVHAGRPLHVAGATQLPVAQLSPAGHA